VTRVLENFDRLGVSGVCVRIGGKLEAFAIGEPLNSDTYVEHFEKAGEMKGSGQFVLQALAKAIPDRYPFLNREQDLGIPGLKKAKESYHPLMMRRKATVRSSRTADSV
jgi:uncharacterized protein